MQSAHGHAQGIAIIGAGAAGLSAAHYLREKGYSRITVVDALVFVGNLLSASQSGRPVSWYRRWPDSDIVVFYMLGQPTLSADQSLAQLEGDLVLLGGEIIKVHSRVHWRYFPHVATADMAAGFYTDLENLQGFRQTWYKGKLLAFPTVEHVVAYSRRLVRSYF